MAALSPAIFPNLNPKANRDVPDYGYYQVLGSPQQPWKLL